MTVLANHMTKSYKGNVKKELSREKNIQSEPSRVGLSIRPFVTDTSFEIVLSILNLAR